MRTSGLVLEAGVGAARIGEGVRVVVARLGGAVLLAVGSGHDEMRLVGG